MSPAPGTLKVLVVDDEPLIAVSIIDMLEDLGHRAASAHSGREALTILETEPDFDLMITDQIMPDIKGTELARLAMSRHGKLVVFLSSGYSDFNGEIDRSLPRLRKPYSLGDLEAMIATRFGAPDHRDS